MQKGKGRNKLTWRSNYIINMLKDVTQNNPTLILCNMRGPRIKFKSLLFTARVK